MAKVVLQDIFKSFGATQVLHGISAEIESGEFVSLLGASGCGKTTLLRIVAGLETATKGSVSIDGRDVTNLAPEDRDIAMMFQSYALLPHLSVAENVRFPLRMRRLGTTAEQRDKVADALETVQLSHLADRRPRQLSGGQQQRVALARAIVSRPKVLLLDEPLSNLDARLREDMQVELIELHKRLGLTTLFVTHDQEEALSLSDRVILINEGRIEQQGAPSDIYAQPATAFASSFLGAANLLPATIKHEKSGPVAVLADGQKLQLDKQEKLRGKAMLALRQEDMALSTKKSSGASLSATVRTRVYLGARNRYVLKLGDERVRVLAPHSQIFERDDTVNIVIDASHVRVIPESETRS